MAMLLLLIAIISAAVAVFYAVGLLAELVINLVRKL